MAKRYREGKLSHIDVEAPGKDVIDLNALGTIAGLDDFLDKAARLAKELQPAPGSLREQTIANIGHWAGHVRMFLMHPEGQSSLARNALLHLLYASAAYTQLLHELIDDQPSNKASSKKLTRRQYLELRAHTKSRKRLADLCDMSPHALRKWEDENNMPRKRGN
jgi:hypothetical protein